MTSSAASSLAVVTKTESERIISQPVFSDLLTDYNTIKNTDIPPPLWATLDADYREMTGLPAPPSLNQIEGPGQSGVVTVRPSDPGSVILKADGTPLRRVPLIRAAKHFTVEDDEDEDSDEDTHNAIVTQSLRSLKDLKEAAARRRAAKPSPMAIATDEAKARVAAARKARSEQMARIDEWGDAVGQLNKQRDEEVVRVIVEQRRMLAGFGGQGRVGIGKVDVVEDESAGRFVELEEDKENVGLAL
ncbi:hypothetical protein GALMADRAFT_246898 [Galerina marginata CBS 339.88]|uniref:Uncharacterized protein n=1 Tax=Galerina marginata (strain CBS 339.88) TaxID=685588 RepID=A0A067TC14_GALM3|nr:hypothetical protein GALMADRAFT_246898 [Galerina marginata CBS 339.88]